MRKLSTWMGLAIVIGSGFAAASCASGPTPPPPFDSAGSAAQPGAGTVATAGVSAPVGGAGIGSVVSGSGGGMLAAAGSGGTAGGALAAGSGSRSSGTGGSAAGSGGMNAGASGSAGTGGTAGSAGADPVAMCVAEAATRGSTGTCPNCACAKCRDKLSNCKDDACVSVLTCGEKSGCQGRACYCGDQDPLTCVISGAKGACMMEIAKAAGVCDAKALDNCAATLAGVTDPTNAMYDANNPVSRANAVSICTRGQKAEAATAVTAAVTAIAGMCETECAK